MSDLQQNSVYKKLLIPFIVLFCVPLVLYSIGKHDIALGALCGVIWSISSFVLLIFASQKTLKQGRMLPVFLIASLKLGLSILFFALLTFYWHINLFGILIGVAFFLPLVIYFSIRV